MSNPRIFPQPFPGLRPYEQADAPLFFGRHTHVAEMVSLLEQRRFLAVVGASGSGKSSLVRAGLLPAICDGYLAVDSDPEDDIWRIVIMRPGDDPYRALAEALVEEASNVSNDGEPPGASRGSDGVEDRRLAPGRSTGEDAARADQVARTQSLLRSSQFGLAYALRDLGIPPHEHVVLLVDQFEELFRFRRDESTRVQAGITTEAMWYERRNDANAFVNLMLKSAEQAEQFVAVILTMRSDFLGDCDAFIDLPEAISRSQYLTPRLTRSQLEDAIREPLKRDEFQQDIASDLVTRILNDVGTAPDQLPLMQHALMRTWQLITDPSRTGTPARHASQSDVTLPESDKTKTNETGKSARPTELRIADYEKVGGVSGALNQHANEILLALGDESSRKRLQRVAVRLFCSLSERRDGGPLTRRPIKVVLAALETGATESDVETVARTFQAANLLVFSPSGQPLGPTTRLDISHESLLRQWRRLEAWIDTETKSALSYRRLMDAVRSDEPTLSDTHLAQAQEWLKMAHPNVYWAMRYDGATQPADSLFEQCLTLIESSHQARLARLAKEQAAAECEQALLREKAEVETQRAREAEAAANRFSRRTKAALSACALAFVFLGFALINLRNAKIATKTAAQKEGEAKTAEGEAKAAKNEAIASRETAQTQQADAKRQNANHYWRFAVNARDNKDPDPLKAAHLFLRGADSLVQIMPAPTDADATSIQKLGLAAHTVDQTIVQGWVHDAPVIGCKLNKDGSRMLSWSQDETARLWDVTKPEPLQTFKHDNDVKGALFSREESRVLTWSSDNTTRLWDVTKPEPIQTFKHDNDVDGAQFSRDESRVLTWSSDNTARLWDVTKSEPIQ
ncbi:MAG: hypothetical protein IAG10_08810, partial [Planctomycetaceae bacterium]|nr:hypothetical protein [Planctomycetaceae bacterium]